MSVNSLPGKWAEEDAVCTQLLALEELLWGGKGPPPTAGDEKAGEMSENGAG